MYRLHLTRNLRTLWMLLVTATILTGIGTVIWANIIGMPRSWRAQIEQQLEKQGAFVSISALRYYPLKGVIAEGVRVYSNKEHTHELSRIGRIILDFEKTKLARGIIRITKLELDKGNVQLPVDPKDPSSEVLNINDVSGIVLMPGGRILEVRDAKGKIAGIQLNLTAQMLGYQQEGPPSPEDPNQEKRREILAKVVHELEKWHFDEKRPPFLQISVEGDLSDHTTLMAKISLHVRGIERNAYTLDEIHASALMEGELLTLTSFKAKDARGELEGHADYDMKAREGRFDVVSTMEIPQLLKAWTGLPSLKEVAINGSQKIEAEGGFTLNEQNIPNIRSTGHVEAQEIILKSVPFESVATSYSWRDGQLYLRDMQFVRGDGTANGKVLIQPPKVRMALHTTLPAYVYRPFFTGLPLDMVLGDFGQLPGASTDVNLEGSFDLNDHFAWNYTGSGKVRHVTFKGVPVNSAECSFTLNHHELDFHDGTAVFDYTDYPMRKAHDGPKEGVASVKRIRYDAEEKVVQVVGVEGNLWTGPVVRLFAPKIAEPLEIYRFHRPPMMKANGVVDVTPAGRTNLLVTFNSAPGVLANYNFLGEDLLLAEPDGKVTLKGSTVLVDDLKLSTFGGPVTGHFIHTGKGQLEGELSWNHLSVKDVASTYGFDMKQGEVTGRIDFSMMDGKVETMNGKGLLSLEKAELFSVPMFGPLSPLVAGALGSKHAGFERAKTAFFTFDIQNGILSSNDFQTNTKSLAFTGDGHVDLRDRTVDMTMRMNARGLLGLITLPLKPFYGLFQFRGTGPLKQPLWENAMFTDPPEKQNKTLLDPPKARVIIEQ